MRRQLLDPIGSDDVSDVVRRTCAASRRRSPRRLSSRSACAGCHPVPARSPRRAFSLAADIDEMAWQKDSSTVRRLPAFDQYVLGPGTDDGLVTPAARRSAVSRQAGWISPVVVSGGVVSGTWELDGEVARIAWFAEAGKSPARKLGAEVRRLSSIVERELRLEVA